MEDNPYQAPRFDELPRIGADAGSVGGARGLSEAEIRAFVGKNANYYLRKWPTADEEFGRARGFNWAAFFLFGLWVPYRKMYRTALIIFGLIVAESALEEVAVAKGLLSEQSRAVFDRVVTLIFWIVCGAFGNAWYLAHTRREIARIRALDLSDDAYREAVARRGGTSFLASVGLFCLFLAVVFVVVIAIQLILSGD
jgi:Protein of unknown function (DUF2628)